MQKASTDAQLQQFLHPARTEPPQTVFENESNSLTKQKNNKFLLKSRSTASILPLINPKTGKCSTKSKHLTPSASSASVCTLPPKKKWCQNQSGPYQDVLKLQKLVKHRERKRLSKSQSTARISLEARGDASKGKSKHAALSWEQHLELLQEYDYNRVILQELCTKLNFPSNDSGRLLEQLLDRNNDIIESVSTALGFERNRIDAVTQSNRKLIHSKSQLSGQLTDAKQKFDDIQHQICDFNASQTRHTKQLELARHSATQSKLRMHDKEYQAHVLQLNLKHQQTALTQQIETLGSELRSKRERLAAFEGYTIQSLFCDAASESTSTTLLITGLNFAVQMKKVRSWFGNVPLEKLSDKFPSRIFSAQANRELLPYAVFAHFAELDSAQFVAQLLHKRAVGDLHLIVHWAKEFPSRHISVRAQFSRQQLLRLYGRFGRIENMTHTGQSYILRYGNEAEAATAILNTHGRRLTLIDDNVDANEANLESAKTTSIVDAVFANDIDDIQFADDEPELQVLANASEERIVVLEDELDAVENLLAVEWTPPEVEDKKAARLKLQEQYLPPTMSLIERYETMLSDANARVLECSTEIAILQQVATDKAALKHLRKYIDPELPTPAQMQSALEAQELETRKLERVVEKWKAKCFAFDTELEKSKTELLEQRIRYQTLKRMKCNRMAKMQRAKKAQRLKSASGNDEESEETPDAASLYERIDELETKLMISNEKMRQFKCGNMSPKTKVTLGRKMLESNEEVEGMQIKLELAEKAMEDKTTEMVELKTQLKDTTLRLNDAYTELETIKRMIRHKDEKTDVEETSSMTMADVVEQISEKVESEKSSPSEDTAQIKLKRALKKLREQLREKEGVMSALKTELKDTKKRNEDFQRAMSPEKNGGDDSAKAMLQRFMKENEDLQRELKGHKVELETAKHDLKQLKQEKSSDPSESTAADVASTNDTTAKKKSKSSSPKDSKENGVVSEGVVSEAAVERVKAELQEKFSVETKAQLTRLKKSQKQSESSLRLKTAEMSQMKKELSELRRAKELCDTLHAFADEDEEDDQLGDIDASLMPTDRSHASDANDNDGSATGRTTSRSGPSTDSTSRGRRSSIMNAKQQKAIVDMMKSRDEAQHKVTTLRERVQSLEKSNKKLSRNHKQALAEVAELKKEQRARMATMPPSNLDDISDPSVGSGGSSRSGRSLSAKMDRRAGSRRASASGISTNRGSQGRTERSRGSDVPQSAERSTGSRSNSTLSTRRSAPRRSYSVAPPRVSDSGLANLTVESLQREVLKLRQELEMWRNAGRDGNDKLDRRASIMERRASTCALHKPLMVAQPKVKQHKEKHKVEKKWKMTKSRFLAITQGAHTKRSVKSKRWILKTIHEIFDSKHKSDGNCLRENRAILALPEFIFHEYIPSRFGIKNLVDAMCWDIHNATQTYSQASHAEKYKVTSAELKEIDTFRRFLEEELSLTDLSFYLKARAVLNENRSLLLDDGLIPFKCINVLLDSILDGALREHRLEVSLRLQAAALLQHDEDVIHKDLFLDLVLRENQLLLHEFEAAVRLLFFHRGLNNRGVLKKEDHSQALQFILKGIPAKDIECILKNAMQSESDDDDLEQTASDGASTSTDNFRIVKPYCAFYGACKRLFTWKQQLFVPALSYNAQLMSLSVPILEAVSVRWAEFKENMVVPILSMFESHCNAYCLLDAHVNRNSHGGRPRTQQTERDGNINRDLLGITKLICRIRDYLEDMQRLNELGMGWDLFLLYTHVLAAVIEGFDLLDQYELKRMVSKHDMSAVHATKTVDNYLFLYEDHVMKRLRRAVSNKSRQGAQRAQQGGGASGVAGSALVSHYLHLGQQVQQN